MVKVRNKWGFMGMERIEVRKREGRRKLRGEIARGSGDECGMVKRERGKLEGIGGCWLRVRRGG